MKHYETIRGLSYENGTNSVFNYSPVFCAEYTDYVEPDQTRVVPEQVTVLGNETNYEENFADQHQV